VSPGAASDRSAEERLREVQAVTDAALGRLNMDDLLVELLDRVRDILDADTAAVLLFDEVSGDLVARAARGIEEEVRQGVRIPLGQGFAGRVGAERRPVVLDRVDATTVRNPILWEKGIRSMLGVPLLSGGRLIGVMHVGSLVERTFTDDDTELCRLAGDRIAGAVQARLLETERGAARALQGSLLPGALPVCAGLEFAARYVPAQRGGIGGDWYDVFILPSGQVWLVAGDVAGHGLRAAVVMGRLRSAIRSYALLGGSPAEVLTLTDRKLQHFEPGEMVTVVCVTLVAPYDRVHVSSAGHPPPVLATPGQPAVFGRSFPTNLPLGVSSGQRDNATFPLVAGGVLLLYTDGLIERRGEQLDQGLERLRSAVEADEADEVCRTVMDRLIGSEIPDDDVAIVAMRRTGT
jgi:sigma-B regulation protein RsbU (phosphoserine phosphatase)